MNRPMLRYGSSGPAVTLLQKGINLAPTNLPRLITDGRFGPKTHARVLEFQRRSNLSTDGVVGDQTHLALEDYYKILDKLIEHLVPPATIAAARERVVDIALAHLSLWGWSQNPSEHFKAEPLSPKIAGREWAIEELKTRQGGLSLAKIFQIAGSSAAGKCPLLEQRAYDMYHSKGEWLGKKHTAEERNNIDIPSWCGIFVTYLFRVSGLKLRNWNRRLSYDKPPQTSSDVAMPAGEPDFYMLDGPSVSNLLEPGDVGLASPAGRFHHFLITSVGQNQVGTVDGNDGFQQTIIKRTYGIMGRQAQYTYTVNDGYHGTEPAYFLKPNWNQILKSS